MYRRSDWSLAGLVRLVSATAVIVANSHAGEFVTDGAVDVTTFVEQSKLSLSCAVLVAQSECPTGTAIRAGISRRHPTHAFEVVLLAEDRESIVCVDVDIVCGEPFSINDEAGTPEEIAERGHIVRESRVSLADAIRFAAQGNQGTPVGAELRRDRNGVHAEVDVFANGIMRHQRIDRVPRPEPAVPVLVFNSSTRFSAVFSVCGPIRGL